MATDLLTLRETIAERLARVIREYILQLRPGFEPGQRIRVRELAMAFGVSTTPVKEALKHLEVHGLVQIRPRHGVFVTRLSLRDVEEIVAIRAGLEQLALRLCGGRVQPDLMAALERAITACETHISAGDFDRYRQEDIVFHRLLVEAGGNQRLVALYQGLLDQLQIVHVYIPRTSANVRASLREHRRLLEVIRIGCLESIEQEIAAHWERSKSRILDAYAMYLEQSEMVSGGGQSVTTRDKSSMLGIGDSARE